MKQVSVIDEVRRVARETGLHGSWKALAAELNQLGIKSPQGKPWDRENVRVFCGRHGIKKELLDNTTTAIQTTQPSAEPAESMPRRQDEKMKRTPTPGLDEDDLKTLHEVIMAWRIRKGEMLNELFAPSHRPVFLGPRRNTGIRISADLLRDALKKAQSPTEKSKTGGGISPLLEYLLWSYLGFDRKYIEFAEGIEPPPDK